jgi:hypothetical protein
MVGRIGTTVVGAMLVALASTAGAADAPATAGDAETRAAMRAILEALRTALPLAASPDRFAAPASRPDLERAFGALTASAAGLATHARGGEPGFERLGRYFAERTGTIEHRYREGEVEESRFHLWMLAESCMDCHERLPSADSRLGSRLIAATSLRSLPPDERVRFEIASRQFTRALDTCEAMFRDREVSPTRLDLGGHLTDYLLVAIRVVDDPGRARRGLTTLRARRDLSRYLMGQLDAWNAALGRLERRPRDPDLLADGRALLDEAARRGRYPADRRVLVEAIAASARFNRFVAAHPAPSPTTAEAYYLLGRAEQLIQRSFGTSLAEFDLETAIEMAPHSAVASEAYDLLEEQTLAAFEGSAGTPLPPDVRARLDRLRRLVGAR